MLRYLPIALTGVFIFSAAVFNGLSTDRWSGANQKALKYVKVVEALPMRIGDWVGEDGEVDEKTQRAAGAIGYVKRFYRNEKTNETVDVWMIVGHAHAVCRHTPNVCYPSDGYRREQKETHYDLPCGPDGEKLRCWTGLFYKEIAGVESIPRVYWMWCDPRIEGPMLWQAPGHHVVDSRYQFGSSKALFKLYFTTSASSTDETPQESIANQFATEFIPVVNDLLVKAKAGELELPEGVESKFDGQPIKPLTADEIKRQREERRERLRGDEQLQ